MAQTEREAACIKVGGPSKRSLEPWYKTIVRKAKKPSPVAKPTAEPAAELRRWHGTVGPEGAPRADVYVAETAGVLSRSQLKARAAVILVNGAEAKPSRPLKAGDRLELVWTDDDPSSIEAEDIPLSIIFEDGRVIVVDKAQGMVTHPGAGNRRGTLANAALFIARRGSAPSPNSGPALRAGIVHRLDKDTSGVIVVAKDLDAQVFLAGQFKERLARKEYLAVTRGVPVPASGRITDRLGRDPRERKRFAAVSEGGKVAVTDYRILASWGVAGRGEGYALVSLRPRTGRTHQLRVHMAGLGSPILGDPIYGRKDGRFPEATLMLHAHRLSVTLPGGGSPSLFVAPVPRRFRDLVASLDLAFEGKKTSRAAVSRGSVPRGRRETEAQ
jgi:23S rRNA pseudouridine1911/1915/1917 synthase